MLAHVEVNRERCRAAASDPQLLATDLADYLVLKGVPFRKAHHAVGALVTLAEKSSVPLNQLTLQQFRSIDPKFGPDVLEVFDLERAMTLRNLPGGPGTREVERQLNEWRRRFVKRSS
jgi:argininosuccinate lyase